VALLQRPWLAGGFAAVALILLGSSREARAQEDDALVAASRLRHFAVNGNPLALMIGRFSGDLQWLPVGTHALVLSPWALYSDSTVTPLAAGDTRTQTGFGSELGYRYYTGSRGANGFFLGGGAIAGYTNATAGFATKNYVSSQTVYEPAESFVFLGGFVDVGVQGILDSGLLVGGGLGLQMTKQLASSASLDVEPRLLFTLGYAF
jgi:hypothetical protein